MAPRALMTHLIIQLTVKGCRVFQVEIHAVWWGTIALAAEEPSKGVVIIHGARVTLKKLAGRGVLRGRRGGTSGGGSVGSDGGIPQWQAKHEPCAMHGGARAAHLPICAEESCSGRQGDLAAVLESDDVDIAVEFNARDLADLRARRGRGGAGVGGQGEGCPVKV